MHYAVPNVFMGDFAPIRAAIVHVESVMLQQKDRHTRVVEELQGAYEAESRASRSKSDFLARMSREIQKTMDQIIAHTSSASASVADMENCTI